MEHTKRIDLIRRNGWGELVIEKTSFWNIVIKALHEVEFHPAEVVKLLQGKTTPREIIGGVR